MIYGSAFLIGVLFEEAPNIDMLRLLVRAAAEAYWLALGVEAGSPKKDEDCYFVKSKDDIFGAYGLAAPVLNPMDIFVGWILWMLATGFWTAFAELVKVYLLVWTFKLGVVKRPAVFWVTWLTTDELAEFENIFDGKVDKFDFNFDKNKQDMELE